MLKILYRFRVLTALGIFLACSLIFLDVYHLVPERLIQAFLAFQFLPSFIFLLKAGGIVFGSFLVFSILGLLVGRVFCAAFCPLGILMDGILYIKRKLNRKHRFAFVPPLRFISIGLLFLALLIFALGSVQLLALLDPYSNFGRIATVLVKPLMIGLNNLAYDALLSIDNYSLHPIQNVAVNVPLIIIVAVFFVGLFYLTIRKGRIFCTHICPVGTFLGLLSRFSLIKIKIDNTKCISCGLCERKCKTACISAQERKLDFSRCVMCMNCLTIKCPTNAIKLSFPKRLSPVKDQANVKQERRKMLASLTLMPLAMAGAVAAPGLKLLPKLEDKNSFMPKKRSIPITPPGALNVNHFVDSCTACYLCVNVCPSNVIKPSLFEYGLSGAFLPQLTNEKGYCNFECNRCTQVCPNGALLPISIEEKKTLQIGVAYFVRELCVVITDKTDCGACSEHCPTKAVNMQVENGLFVPVVDESICIGCGACEFACPVTPEKAIFVQGSKIHGVAEKPKSKKLKSVDLEEDFPF
jgi:ferredoxin